MKFVSPSALLLAATFLTVPLAAQSPIRTRPVDRITTVIDDRVRVVRRGNVHPLARVEFDQGPAQADLRMDRMVLVLEPTPAQQSSLETLLASQQDPASPQYHQWMTPDDFGAAFGVSDRDLDQITGWLTARGFQVEPVDSAQRSIVFSGSAAQVETAFHTSIHVYNVNGDRHYANAGDPELPQALAGVVQGLVSLHDFPLTPAHHNIKPVPELTSGTSHYLAPADFATIYNVNGLYNNSIDGTGQSVAVVGRTNFNMSDVTSFRSRFALPVKNPTVVLNGADPGIVSSGELSEALLDVEWAGAVAKNANVQFVLSASTNTSDGVTLSSQYIVSHNLAPVMSLSFGSCESSMGTSGNQFWNALWQQAAAQGITVLVASGDSGAAGCAGASASTASSQGVSGLCSSPYSTCVGGTQFADTSNPTAYWSATSNATTGASALSYIPEAVWNQSASTSGGSGLWSGGGGASLIYPKPAWQSGPGVPADGHRDVPDVSLTASTHDGYLVTMSGQVYIFGGTSASTPAMAGLMTLLAQKTGTRQGNANPAFYALASRQAAGGASVFHDTTAGNNTVPGVTGFSAGPGYDLGSGLGSVDAAVMVNHWADGAIPAPAFQLTVPATASVTMGANKQATAQVTVSGGFSGAMALSATGAPTGLTVNFSPAGFSTPGSGSSTITLAAGSTATPGTYNLTIKATSGSAMQSSALAVTILSNCSYSSSATSASATAAGGNGTVNVTAGTGCAWTASSNASWITIASGATGSANGAVQYSVAKNTGTTTRAGTLTIAGITFTLTQAAAVACTYSLNATSATAAVAGGIGTVNVTSATGCAWTATSNASWITIASGATGSANGAVQYSVAKNTGTSTRAGTLTIAGATFTVTQAAAVATCTLTVQPGPLTTVAGGYSATIGVTAGSTCSWTAVSNASWITIKSGSSGSGNGAATIFAAAKTSGPARSGTFVVAGYTFTFTEN